MGNSDILGKQTLMFLSGPLFKGRILSWLWIKAIDLDGDYKNYGYVVSKLHHLNEDEQDSMKSTFRFLVLLAVIRER